MKSCNFHKKLYVLFYLLSNLQTELVINHKILFLFVFIGSYRKRNYGMGNNFPILDRKISSMCCRFISRARDNATRNATVYFLNIEDFSSSSFQSSRSFLPSQIARNTETIITTITTNPATKKIQISRSTIAKPSIRKAGSRIDAHPHLLTLELLYDFEESNSIERNPTYRNFQRGIRQRKSTPEENDLERTVPAGRCLLATWRPASARNGYPR